VRHRPGSDRRGEAGTQNTAPPRRVLFPPSRRGLIGLVVAVALVAAGGLTAVSVLGSGRAAVAGRAGDGVSLRATASASGRAAASAAAPMPQVASGAHLASMPTSAARAPASGRASASASTPVSHRAAPGRPAPSGGATPSAGPRPSGSASPSGAPTSTAPVAAGSASCANPSFSTSAPDGMWNVSPYFVSNNMWNASGYSVTQTLYACSHSDWYVTATMNNDSGDGAVKTYPNSQRDFDDPQISSLNSVTSTFAQTTPHAGIYEDAYDIWLNGLATSGSTEVMIWTQNNGQTPSGSVEGSVTFDGRTYTVWKSGSYVAFVANANVSSGTVNLLAFFQWIIGKGWIPGDSTLSQVCYGAELVSTNGVPATFAFSDYSVNAS
jgi:Glycosyl hydrolase family 12